MMPVLRIVAVVVALAIFGVRAPLSQRVAAAEPFLETTKIGEARSIASLKPVWVGAAGCSAASCHGGREGLGGEYTHWATRDAAHRRAYNVLLSDVSHSMAAKLGIAAAHQEARCLACHSMDAGPTAAIHGDRFAVEFGVACESCHGAAGKWIARHTERSWKTLSDPQKSEFGFRNLRSLDTRADSCVACHVGSPRATVDHDLIAAGHPRLSFELAAYQALMPKHWNESAALQREPDQELKLWMLGQVKSAKAIADIAVARAESAVNAKADQVSPDLAEFDCHACHHDLAEKSWRGRLKLGKKIGEPQWGSWSITSAKWIAGESKSLLGQDHSAAQSSLGQWATLMQNSWLRAVPANELATTAGRASSDLAAWSQSLNSQRVDAVQAASLLRQLLAAESDAAFPMTWDGQAQRYLAVVAARQSLRDLTHDTPTSQVLRSQPILRLQELLKFPAGFATPRDFHADDVEQLFRALGASRCLTSDTVRTRAGRYSSRRHR